MLESAAPGSTIPPSPKYRKAREVVVTVKPDRINLAANPGFEVDTSNVSVDAGTLTRVTTTSRSGAACGQWVTTAVSAGYTQPTAIPGRPSTTYTMSVWVKGSGSARIRMGSGPGGYVVATSNTVELVDSAWTRLHVTGVTRPDTANVYLIFDQMSAGAQTMYLDDILVERGTELRDYFDGSTSVDTLWEGAVGTSRSYLYKNRAARYAAIKRVLEDNVPLGIGVAEPVFGTLPVDW
jgi:hypothetical protein